MYLYGSAVLSEVFVHAPVGKVAVIGGIYGHKSTVINPNDADSSPSNAQ